MSALTIIENFVHQIDIKIKIDFDSYFYTLIDEKIIYIEDTEHYEDDCIIQNFIKKDFNVSIDPFLFGILHEVGHIITYNQDTNFERILMYSLLVMAYESNRKEEYFNLYFHIPAEYEATKWAINFYKQNKQLCDSFLNELYSD